MDGLHTRRAGWKDKVLVAIFGTVIAAPFTVQLMHLDPAPNEMENRRLAPFPRLAFTARAIDAFPEGFEKYFRDHFGLRSELIRWHHLWKLRLLNVSPSPNVVLGKDGWLFDAELITYLQAPPLTEAELEKWRIVFEEKERFASQAGAAYFLVFAPSPPSIYSEVLPDWVRRRTTETRLDQLLQHLRIRTRISVIDLRGPLLEAKSQVRLYHRTDSHWNDHGAYIAYQKIMESVAMRVHGTDPLPRSSFKSIVRVRPGGDTARMLALPDLLTEENLELAPLIPRRARIIEWLPEHSAPPPAAFSMETGDDSKPCAVVFHDSFAYASLYPFLAEHFSEVWFHWNHYFGPGLQVSHGRGMVLWNPDRMATARRGLKPSVVIQEFAERSLLFEPPEVWSRTAEGSSATAVNALLE